MHSSYLTADTFGIGELIAQRKRFRVPEHQRDFAWTDDEVGTFIDDILNALESDTSEYFIGLIVLIGPSSGVWQILDGQQRIATTTMLFSAIRGWLRSAGYDTDAKQVEQEFIGLRQLGGVPEARLSLNVNDRQEFQTLVVGTVPDPQLQEAAKSSPRYSSRRLLAKAAMTCRRRVGEWAEQAGSDLSAQAAHVYRLSQFLESGVKVVCLEIASESDAYMIFESLNYRGQDLSVLDLVKNHLYSLSPKDQEDAVAEQWGVMIDNISDSDADDFLKVFWTSRFGRVQRGRLFTRIKQEFTTEADGEHLTSLLAAASYPYAALEDPTHALWLEMPPACRLHVSALSMLRAKQIRPVVLASVQSGFSHAEIEVVLRLLLTLTVRYQTVGRRRTGALEIACAKMSEEITNGQIRDAEGLLQSIRSVAPADQDFTEDFRRYSEGSAKRARYVLAALEVHKPGTPGGYSPADLHDLLEGIAPVANLVMPRKLPAGYWQELASRDPDLHAECVNRIGNWYLVRADRNHHPAMDDFDALVDGVLRDSTFEFTREITSYSDWGRQAINERQARLASHASATWPLEID